MLVAALVRRHFCICFCYYCFYFLSDVSVIGELTKGLTCAPALLSPRNSDSPFSVLVGAVMVWHAHFRAFSARLQFNQFMLWPLDVVHSAGLAFVQPCPPRQ